MSIVARLKKAFPFQQGGEVHVEVGSYRRFMRRDYWMVMPDGRLVPMPDIRGCIHEPEEDRVASLNSMVAMLDEAGVNDGDEFEILITRTGHRPHGDRRFVMDRWGETRPETDEECLKRIEDEADNLDKAKGAEQ